MFGISLGEIVVIFIISLLFFKPSDIFSFFGKIQDFLTKIKLEAETLKNEILLKEMKDVQEMKDEIYKDFIENEFSEISLNSKKEENKINKND
jgi:Sec-independent protein translocase protein TatA